MKLSVPAPAVPLFVKIVGLALAAFAMLFGASCVFNPAQIAPGVNLAAAGVRLAFYTIGGMTVGLAVGLVLAVMSGRAESLVLILIVRVVMAIMDLIIALALSLGPALVILQLVFIAACGASLAVLFNAIRAASQTIGV